MKGLQLVFEKNILKNKIDLEEKMNCIFKKNLHLHNMLFAFNNKRTKLSQ